MNTITTQTKTLVLKCLVEGISIGSTARIADVSRNTVTKLLIDAGKVCAKHQDRALRGLPCSRIEVDEVWSFVYAKERNVPRAKSTPAEAGDVWTWTAICADTKLVPSWIIGDRTSATGIEFMDDLRSRLANRVQTTSDGHKAYLDAVESAFGDDVDYTVLIKLYGPSSNDKHPEARYSPSPCIGAEKRRIEGAPNVALVSTSHVERQNLHMRMSMRRFTRLTNAFSKKIENHAHSVALHFMHYNFCRLHQTLGITPAMKAGVTEHPWEVGDIVKMVEDATPAPNRPKTYRKHQISN